MRAYSIALIPYGPLAGGLLTGKYKRDAPLPKDTRLVNEKKMAERWLNDTNWTIVQCLDNFSQQRGHSLLELSFSWLASHPFVSSIIAGATSREQLELNVRAIDWKLTTADMAEIDRLTRGI